MSWFLGALVVAVLGAVVVVASGRGGGYPDTEVDRASRAIPDPVTAQDLRSARFNVTLRGYRQVEVDALLERLAAQLEAGAAAGAVPQDGAGEPPVEE